VKFSGKTCLITGAAGNLGRAVAAAFAAEGASLVLMDHAEEHLRSAYGAEGQGRRFAVADLRDPQSVARALPAGARIDILCNIAGGFRMGQAVHETSDDTWDLMLGLNAKSVVNCARASFRHARGRQRKNHQRRRHGGLVRQGEHGRLHRLQGRGHTPDRDHGRGIAGEGHQRHCILPSTIDTPQNRKDMPKADPKRWVAPEALAEVVLFLPQTPRALFMEPRFPSRVWPDYNTRLIPMPGLQ